MTPLQAIKKHCAICLGVANYQIELCTDYGCQIHPANMEIGRVKARNIKKFCIQCAGEGTSTILAHRCDGKVTNMNARIANQETICPLHPFRHGKAKREGLKGDVSRFNKGRHTGTTKQITED